MSAISDPLRHAARYRVRFDEAGPDGRLRTSGLLRYAQDVAWQHSDAHGLTRESYTELGLAWVVRAAVLETAEPVPMGVEVEVETRVLGFERIWARRRAELRLRGGLVAAWIQTDWVMIDARGRPARVPAAVGERFPAPRLEQPLLRVRVGEPPDEARIRTFRVRPHELDPLNHVNNAVYVDWLEESEAIDPDVGSKLLDGRFRPTRLSVEYAAPAGPGAEVESAAWDLNGARAHRLRTDGSDVVRAIIER